MLLPLDDRPRLSTRRPWAVWSLGAALALCFALAVTLPPGAHAARGGPAAGLLTHLLSHGDALHLLGNLAFLLVFGPNVERRLGPAGLVLLFAACGAAGGLAFSLAEREGALIGASGAVLGLTAFHAVALAGQRVLVVVWLLVVWIGEVPARWLALALLALDLAALLTTGFGGGRVAVAAHLGGWLAGAVAGVAVRYRSARAKAANRVIPASMSASEQA